MMKKKCPQCGRGKAKRACGIKGGIIICPICCSSLRNAECEGCSYYETSQSYREGKKKNVYFTTMIDPEIEDRCDEALALAEAGKIKKAERLFADLLDQYPDYHTVQFGVGTCHAFQDRLDKAIACFKRAVEIFPLFSQAHFNLGMAYCKHYEIAKSIRAFREVIHLNDLSPNLLAEAKNRLNILEKCLMDELGLGIEACLKSNDTFDEAFGALQNKEFDKALKLFDAVLSLTPNHHQSWGNKGLAYAGLGKKQESLACLDKALELNPKYEVAAANRIAIECMKEGERFEKMKSVYYGRDYGMKKRSYFAELMKKIMG